MKENKFIRLLCSIPVIIIMLYFIPFLGILLMIFRYYVHRYNKFYLMPTILLILGFILMIPNVINAVLNTFKLTNINIPYLQLIIKSNIYIKLLKYAKLLIIISIIAYVLSFVIKSIIEKVKQKVSGALNSYVEKEQQKDYEISQKNDLIMKEKREKALNTKVVYCPYCGADNMLTSHTGICKYCRRKIEYKDKK